jgi:hypothetical protein
MDPVGGYFEALSLDLSEKTEEYRMTFGQDKLSPAPNLNPRTLN